MLSRGVVDYQLRDHAQPPAVRLADKGTEIPAGAVVRMDVLVVGDVVAIIAHRRRVERQQPQRVDTQILNVIGFFASAHEGPRCRRRCHQKRS